MPFSSDIIYSNSVWLPDVNNETYYAVPSHVPVLYKCVILQHFPDYIYDAAIIGILNVKDSKS